MASAVDGRVVRRRRLLARAEAEVLVDGRRDLLHALVVVLRPGARIAMDDNGELVLWIDISDRRLRTTVAKRVLGRVLARSSDEAHIGAGARGGAGWERDG